MEVIVIYLLKMLVCSAVLFIYYRLALYNEHFHQWNRFYLLAALGLSLVLPLVSIPVFAEKTSVIAAVPSMPWNVYVGRKPVSHTWDVSQILLAGLVFISLLLLVKLFFGIASIYKIYRQNPVQNLNEDIRLVLTQHQNAPFSFFTWLFWRQNLDMNSSSGQRMLAHEIVHIRERHSYDKLFVEVVLCIFWINPFFWLIRKEIEVIHEFLADQKAIEKNNGHAFAEMVLQTIHSQPINALSNPFFTSQIKRRLFMLTSSKKSQFSYLRRLSGFAIMIMAAILLTVNLQKAEAQKSRGSKKIEVSSKDSAIPAKLLYIVNNKEVSKEAFEKITPEQIINISVLKGKAAIEKYGEKGKYGVIEVLKKTGEEVKFNKNAPVEIDVRNPDIVFSSSEQPPQFVGGADGWRKYLEQNIKYPEAAQKAGAHASVNVEFIVYADGSLGAVKAQNNPGNGLAEEAVRIVEKSPNWQPAAQNGLKVAAKAIQTITF